jgi:LCP family protein required for cell wall assembly
MTFYNDKYRNRSTVRKKKRKLKKRAFVVLALLIAFIAVGGYLAYLYITAGSVFSDAYEDDGREKSDLREHAVHPKDDNVSVLIMGVDASNTRNNAESARTDSLMVATFNRNDKSVKLLSIPRDSYVYIPEVGYKTKINHAYAFGGTRGTIETVENLLEIPIDYYVKVNFEAFIDVVDAVNGVKVDVPYELREMDSKDKKDSIHLMPGVQELNGEEALALARTRKLDNDIERGKRQQEILGAVANKALSLGSVFKYDDMIHAVGNNMTTNMTFSELKGFIAYGTKGKNLNMESLTLEGRDYQPSNTYYWQLDEASLAKIKEKLKAHLEL